MLHMHYTHIPKSDLNLLTSLQVLMEERSISRAARRMFLSQSAMSRIFDRLQAMFDDELLIRTEKGYEPTQRASAASAELQELLPKIEILLRGRAFCPATATDEFRIAATNYASVWLFPRLLDCLMKQAPRIQIHLSSWDDGFRRLEANSVDLFLTAYPAPPHLRSELLVQEPFVCLVRKGHPIGARRITLDRYLKEQHVGALVDPTRQRLVDRTLDRMDKQRDVRSSVPYLFMGSIVERTNLIATIPARAARRLTKLSRTRTVPAPVEFEKFSYYQIWHPRNDTDAAHGWLRGTLRKICVPRS
jgi:DNA-binding transcriptional LysR family regulator